MNNRNQVSLISWIKHKLYIEAIGYKEFFYNTLLIDK